MDTTFRAIVELGCHCGERLELPFEDIRTSFDCPSCDYQHVLEGTQIETIEEAFGRALVQAHRRQKDDPVLPSAAVRH